MSLDFHLERPGEPKPCPWCDGTGKEPNEEVESFNITHNLRSMASAAGIYMALWRPDECGITNGAGMIGPLTEGLARLKADPAQFAQFNASNGWGTYEQFVPWVERVLKACMENPDANVRVSR